MTTPEAGPPTPLLATKLRAPRRRPGLVDRPRLRPRLVAGDRPRLTLISAPAGFGKTTLLTDWYGADEHGSTAWVSLDAGDNDPVVFLTYLLAALDATAPGTGDGASSLLRSSPTAVEAIATTLINDLAARPGDVVLVLDDYHVIESTVVHETMAFLVERLPPSVQLVIASRADPPFPLARLRARGLLEEVRAEELRFTAEEAATYLTDTIGLDLDVGEVDALETRTEGWIAALQLAALSMQGREDLSTFVAGFTGDDRFVVDYLAEEVLERQRADVRAFLLATSILGRLSGSLCDAVAATTSGATRLESLDRANLFLVPLDDHRHWYRYHHLFGDVLRARLLAEDPDRVPELHLRASVWFEDHGEVREAIDHAVAAGEAGRAARLIELAGDELRRSRQEVSLRRWLESLPTDVFADRPVLSLSLVGARMGTGDTSGVEALLQDVERWLDPAEPKRPGHVPIVEDEVEWASLPAQLAVYRAGLALLGGDVPGTLAHAGRVFELAEPTDHLRLGSASALLGLALWHSGDLIAARSRYHDAVDHLADAGFVPDELGCRLALADIQKAQGRLGDAEQTLRVGLDHARLVPGLRGTADMHVALAEVHIERDDLDEADRHLGASRDLGPHAGLPQHPYRWRVAEARLSTARGDRRHALEMLDEAQAIYDTDFSPSVRPIPAIVARVHLRDGRIDAARRWRSDRGLTAHDAPDHLAEFEHLTLAHLLVAERDQGAVPLLNRLRAAAEDGRRDGSVTEILVLLALAHLADDDRPAAAAALDQALSRAEPEDHLRPFVDEAGALASLLRAHAEQGRHRAFARRILDGVTGDDPAPRPAGAWIPDLSDRELDVLRLLRSDLSGPDIARELHVSLNTLRTHTKNIYAKLGVNTRRQAVTTAAELGL